VRHLVGAVFGLACGVGLGQLVAIARAHFAELPLQPSLLVGFATATLVGALVWATID
jgi:hypothetical protein